MNPRRRLDAAARGFAQRKGYVLAYPPSLVTGLCAMAGASVGLAPAGYVGAVAGGFGGCAVPWLAMRLAPDRRAERLDAQVPELLEGVARALRAGRSLVGALATATNEVPEPLAVELRTLKLRVEAGVALRDALADSSAATRSAPLCTALGAIAIANEAGGAQAMVFDALAASLRSRAAAARELRSLTTPVRVSAMLIALAPPAMFSAVVLFDRSLATRAFTTAPGRIAALAGVVLDLVGLWWIRALTRFVP